MRGVAEIWQQLKTTSAKEPGWKSLRIAEESPCALRVAIREPSGEPALLCEVSSISIAHAVEYPEGKGFRLFAECIKPGPHGTTRLCLVLSDWAYKDMFEVLVEDIADVVALTSDHKAAVRGMLSRLRDWQAFMRRGSDGLSLEEQTGLFAELLTLEAFLDAGVEATVVVKGWTGPQLGLRDFKIGSTEVEVKAGVGTHASKFHVSHLDQLDESTVDKLLLFHYALIEDIEGITLPKLVEKLKCRIEKEHPAEAALLNDLLFAAGYANFDEDTYQRRLSVRQRRVFIVKDNFPRLLRNEIRLGLCDVDYIVDIAACFPYELNFSSALHLITGRPVNA